MLTWQGTARRLRIGHLEDGLPRPSRAEKGKETAWEGHRQQSQTLLAAPAAPGEEPKSNGAGGRQHHQRLLTTNWSVETAGPLTQ